MHFNGIYVGIVESNADPAKLGRVKVRVPTVYGLTTSRSGAVPLNDIPWAEPCGTPAGGSGRSGGTSWLPEAGDQVFVQFLDGEPEKPVWMWGPQTTGQSANFPLHQYNTTQSGNVLGPKRAAWTRYGHTVEWTAEGLIATTANGYRLVLTDGLNDGELTLSTSAGQQLVLDDSTNTGLLFILDDFFAEIGDNLTVDCQSFNLNALVDGISFTAGTDFELTAARAISLAAATELSVTAEALSMDIVASASVTAGVDLTLEAPRVALGLAATEPAVLGAQLITLLTNLYVWLSTHVHTSGSSGSPTSPPLQPIVAVQPLIPEIVSGKVFLT